MVENVSGSLWKYDDEVVIMNHNATGLDEKGTQGYLHKRRCGHSPDRKSGTTWQIFTSLDSVGKAYTGDQAEE